MAHPHCTAGSASRKTHPSPCLCWPLRRPPLAPVCYENTTPCLSAHCHHGHLNHMMERPTNPESLRACDSRECVERTERRRWLRACWMALAPRLHTNTNIITLHHTSSLHLPTHKDRITHAHTHLHKAPAQYHNNNNPGQRDNANRNTNGNERRVRHYRQQSHEHGGVGANCGRGRQKTTFSTGGAGWRRLHTNSTNTPAVSKP